MRFVVSCGRLYIINYYLSLYACLFTRLENDDSGSFKRGYNNCWVHFEVIEQGAALIKQIKVKICIPIPEERCRDKDNYLQVFLWNAYPISIWQKPSSMIPLTCPAVQDTRAKHVHWAVNLGNNQDLSCIYHSSINPTCRTKHHGASRPGSFLFDLPATS